MPAISKIFSYVAQQERQLSGNNLMTLESKGNVINAVKFACDFCGRAGHTENVCYKKHRMPSGYDGKNKGNNAKIGKACTHCGKNGHTVDVCYRKHGFSPGYTPGYRSYNTKATANSIVTVDDKVTDDQIQRNESQEVRFSPEQYKALLALIQQPSHGSSTPNSSHAKKIASISSCSTNPAPTSGIILSTVNRTHTHLSWILDSGTTDHVSSSLTHFHSYKQINPIMVKLPNGHHV